MTIAPHTTRVPTTNNKKTKVAMAEVNKKIASLQIATKRAADKAATVTRQQFRGTAGDVRQYADHASTMAIRNNVRRLTGFSPGQVSSYAAMLTDPFDRAHATRYPDDTILATSLNHLTTSYTYAVGPTGSFLAGLRWKVCNDPVDASIGSNVYSTWPIKRPCPAVGNGGLLTEFYWNIYGTPQETWAALSNTDRTLACGLRVKLNALPTQTFMGSGNLYFLQIQTEEEIIFLNSISDPINGESYCRQMVTAGKGYSVNCHELDAVRSGLSITYMPQGPMSFVFSDTNAIAPVLAGILPDHSVAVEGNPAALSSTVASNGRLYIVGYGLQQGLQLTVDYAHHIEYTPAVGAAGLLQSKIQPPDSGARDAIATTSAKIVDARSGATSLDALLKNSASNGVGGPLSGLLGGYGATVGSVTGASIGARYGGAVGGFSGAVAGGRTGYGIGAAMAQTARYSIPSPFSMGTVRMRQGRRG